MLNYIQSRFSLYDDNRFVIYPIGKLSKSFPIFVQFLCPILSALCISFNTENPCFIPKLLIPLVNEVFHDSFHSHANHLLIDVGRK